MFVAIISFPPIRAGKDAEFLEWFAWTNREFSTQKGFIRRRFLKPLQGGDYAAVVEHESPETFMAMHSSPMHGEAEKRLRAVLDGHPTPRFYEAVVG